MITLHCTLSEFKAHKLYSTKNNIFVTISLDIKFIGSSKIGDEIIGKIKIEKITNSLVFASCTIKSKNKIQFICGNNLYKKIINKKYPSLIKIVQRNDLPNDYGEMSETN